MGRSIKFKNLFYNLGNTDADLEKRVRNANFIRDQIARDILYINDQSLETIADPVEINALKPGRFLMWMFILNIAIILIPWINLTRRPLFIKGEGLPLHQQ